MARYHRGPLRRLDVPEKAVARPAQGIHSTIMSGHPSVRLDASTSFHGDGPCGACPKILHEPTATRRALHVAREALRHAAAATTTRDPANNDGSAWSMECSARRAGRARDHQHPASVPGARDASELSAAQHTASGPPCQRVRHCRSSLTPFVGTAHVTQTGGVASNIH